jgi:pantoate--beta-alanine ligase
VVASVFVNPAQFAPGEDFDAYPRRLERDRELLSGLGVDHLFAPDAGDMYGPNHATYVAVEGFDDGAATAEGGHRPGHFRGVATVVTKLFNIVQPAAAYFGRKDAAQCALIRRVVSDLNLDVEVRVQPTVREPDGLAMSSRNAYLTEEERRAAPVLYRALSAAKEIVDELSDETETVPAQELRDVVEGVLRDEPLVSQIQYVAVDDLDTMRPVRQVSRGDGAILSAAIKIGNVRLIDNVVLGSD